MVQIYKVIGENNIFNILDTVIQNRGIKDKDKFLSPSESDILDFNLLKNMDLAVKMFEKHQANNSSVTVLVDSDPDGYTSSAIIVSYIRENFLDMKVNYILHSGRQHGLTDEVMNELEKSLPDLLIIPDASSNDLRQHAELKKKGVDTIILDHHILENEESKDAIVVSNQKKISPDYSNRELSGAGIALKFIEALDSHYETNSSKEYYTLAAVGIVADMMPILHPETRYYVYEGLKDINNSFIRQLVYKNAYHALKSAYPKTVSWSISNFINATIRMGTKEDKLTMFRALLEEKETLNRISKYRGVEREVSEELHETAVRLATNARSRQNTQKKKIEAEIIKQIESEKLNDNSFVIVALDDIRSGFSGFVAGSLVGTYRKPVLITSWNEERQAYEGSLRGHDSVMLDTRGFLDELGLFNYCSGHGQAAGVSFSKGNVDKINEVINEIVGDSKTPVQVDFEVSSKSLDESLVKEFYQYNHLWCKGFEEPLVAVKDVEINCANITFGNTMKFSVGGVEILSFQVDDRLRNLADKKMIATCDIIGTLEINHFLGNKTPQMKVEVIDIKSTKEDNFGGFVF